MSGERLLGHCLHCALAIGSVHSECLFRRNHRTFANAQPPECNNYTLASLYWGEIDNCLEWYKKNTLLIEAYYERMNYQIVTEVESYTVPFLSPFPVYFSPHRSPH